ncbi:MAG: hypothetical protein N3D84_03935, partial [Candidatus Woesearchaeota archaeon]|nr:hypothetical protein [Candidatus Woesearchaeota archaeon]
MARKGIILVAQIVLFLIFLSLSVYSIGLSSQPLPSYIIAEPGAEHSFFFIADGFGHKVDLYILGDLKDYVSLENVQEIGNSKKSFTAKVSFPEEIDAAPGIHTVFIGAAEIDETKRSGISVLTKVQSPLRIFVLYPGKYLEIAFYTQNVNENETANFRIEIKNFGKEDIDEIYAVVDIYNYANDKVKSITTEKYSLKSGKEDVIPVDVNTTGMMGGAYR